MDAVVAVTVMRVLLFGFGLGLYQSCRKHGSVGRVSACFGCGDVDGVDGEWGMGRVLEPGSGGVGWCYICVTCESGFSV